jgi:hypothetical protein
MRARIAQFATPRKLVAMECGAAALATASGVLVLGAGRIERRGPQ